MRFFKPTRDVSSTGAWLFQKCAP